MSEWVVDDAAIERARRRAEEADGLTENVTARVVDLARSILVNDENFEGVDVADRAAAGVELARAVLGFLGVEESAEDDNREPPEIDGETAFWRANPEGLSPQS